MRLAIVLVLAAGCGRFGFGTDRAMPDASDDDAAPADHDEDHDGVADRIDVCPATPDPGQQDVDGDGVGDACDPDNGSAQRIVLFEPFAGTGLPPGWTAVGAASWSVANDDLTGSYNDIEASAFVAPMDLSPPLTIQIAYALVMVDSAVTNHTKSIVDTFDLASSDSQKCGEASPQNHVIGHEVAGTTVDGTNVPYIYDFDIGANYVTTMTHTAASITCVTEVPAIGAPATVSVQRAPYRTTGRVGLRIRSVSVAYHYVVVIGT